MTTVEWKNDLENVFSLEGDERPVFDHLIEDLNKTQEGTVRLYAAAADCVRRATKEKKLLQPRGAAIVMHLLSRHVRYQPDMGSQTFLDLVDAWGAHLVDVPANFYDQYDATRQDQPPYRFVDSTGKPAFHAYLGYPVLDIRNDGPLVQLYVDGVFVRGVQSILFHASVNDRVQAIVRICAVDDQARATLEALKKIPWLNVQETVGPC